jgi:pantoate--beta-alanine ligase
MPRELAVVRSIADLRQLVRGFRSAGETVALVPTMGALHDGHLALVRAGQQACDRVIATIFVNPTQFGPTEDLQSYPRDEAGDLAQLRRVDADGAFLPVVDEMYPPGAATTVSVSGVSDGLCGPFRLGHFAGVATVVCKLLLQALPDVALFGEKDYQQLQVITRMARDLDVPVRIAGVPTVREPDGVALSSRNRYLTSEQRAIAPRLYGLLTELAATLADGRPAASLLADGRTRLAAWGFAPVHYLELCDADTLTPLAAADRPARLLVAAYLGRTRLIDNVPVP